MTTVAGDATLGLMASDSQWTDDNEKGICRKVWRIQGALIGFAGDIKTIEACKVWFKKGKAGPPPRGDVAALILMDLIPAHLNLRDVVISPAVRAKQPA